MEMTTSTKKPVSSKKSKNLNLTQMVEYHDRVSGFALYTNANIVKRENVTTWLRISINAKAGKNTEMVESVVILDENILNNDLGENSKDIQAKGKAMFRIVCDGLRISNGYKAVVFTTAYGDKYSYSKNVTRLYDARAKKWETV